MSEVAVATALAVSDGIAGAFLLRSARRRPRNREAVVTVAVFLLVAAVWLTTVAWQVGHPRRPPHVEVVNTPGEIV